MAFLDAFRVLLPIGRKRKKPRCKGKAVRQRGAGAFVPGDVAAEHGALRVLVADLDGPGGSAAAEQVAAVLVEAGGIDVYRRAAPLKQPTLATLLDRLSAAAEEGQAWLKQEDCELLVWGEVEGEGGRIACVGSPHPRPPSAWASATASPFQQNPATSARR